MSPFDRAHDFLLTFHSNHGSITHRFRDRRRCQSKIAIFSHPRVFGVLVGGFPLELDLGAWGQKKLEKTGPRKKFDDIFSHLDTMRERDGQTGGRTNRRTDTGR